jgi:hypothetical protein
MKRSQATSRRIRAAGDGMSGRMMRAAGRHDAAIIAADPASVTSIAGVALRLLLIPGGGQVLRSICSTRRQRR